MGGYVSRWPTGRQGASYNAVSLSLPVSKVANPEPTRPFQRSGHGPPESGQPQAETPLNTSFLVPTYDACGTPVASGPFFYKMRSAGPADNFFDERTPSTRGTCRSAGGCTPYTSDSAGPCSYIDSHSPRTGETWDSPVFFSPLTGTSDIEIDDGRPSRVFGASTRRRRFHDESRETRATRHLGLLNLGNTCYANSVIQVLYQCPLFRTYCIKEVPQAIPGGILESLGQLFSSIKQQKNSWRRCTRVNPAKFINTLKKKNEIFRLPAHQDAHEFFCYLVNEVRDELAQRYFNRDLSQILEQPRRGLRIFSRKVSQMTGGRKRSSFPNNKGSAWHSRDTTRHGMLMRSSRKPCRVSSLSQRSESEDSPKKEVLRNSLEELKGSPFCLTGQSHWLWICDLFQGCLVYETRCLRCKNVSLREETFIDIPLECTGKNISIGICHFTRPELLTEKEKYFCEVCGCLQEAERRVRFRRLPRILTIHLKRFKFDETTGGYARVSNRVEFPLRLAFPREALWNDEVHSQNLNRTTSESAVITESAGEASDNWPPLEFRPWGTQEASPCYDLFGVVVHIGTTISRGHYVCCVKCHGNWFLFDDHIVKRIMPEELCNYFGSANDLLAVPSNKSAAECGYLLFYVRSDSTPAPVFDKSM